MTILKDKAAAATDDAMQAAGDRAERTLAFYLKRAFTTDPSVLVFNDLRLTEADDAAQIDHLIVHAAGFVLIESKSVTTKVKVNRRGEWTRLWDGHWKGMPSPVLQAKRQADFLRDYLQRRREPLRDRKMLGLIQGGFTHFDMRCLVAVSDSGMIVREADDLAPEVFKADQIVDQVTGILAAQRKAAGLGTRIFGKADDVRPSMTAEELERVTAHLLRAHAAPDAAAAKDASPRDPWGFSAKAAEPEPEAAPEPEPEPEPDAVACRSCGSAALDIRHGRFGYYWKCAACDGNTPIDLTAPDGGKGRLRKEGDRFFLVWGEGEEILFHVNAAPAAATSTT